jgi:hypothetical protein
LVAQITKEEELSEPLNLEESTELDSLLEDGTNKVQSAWGKTGFGKDLRAWAQHGSSVPLLWLNDFLCRQDVKNEKSFLLGSCSRLYYINHALGHAK